MEGHVKYFDLHKKYPQHRLAVFSKGYPSLLGQVYDPPKELFVRGHIPLNINCLAVIGSRKCSDYAKQVVQSIIPKLVKQDIVIISGLARGIDSLAHQATIDAGGQTIAVLGSGMDKQSFYPPENWYLGQSILKNNGCIISEYPDKTRPTKYSFPCRNRIIAGMAVGTLVIEAGTKSGTLITAQYALDNGREVMAIPQNIDSPTAKGVNHLIKQGAHLITCASDVLRILNSML